MKIEIRPLASITQYARNPRRNQSAVATVKASLKEYGWQQPIVVDAEGVIIAGHTRYLAALELGWTDAPVQVAEGLTPAQIKAYRIMDNRSHERAEWDMDLLALEMEDLKALDFDLDLTGFSTEDLAGIEAAALPHEEGSDTEPQIDRAEELRQKWGVEPGQLWQLGEHRLICGDCTDAAVVARVMGGDSFDLVVTSPPYNSGDGGYKTDYNGKVKRFYQDDTDDRTEAEWVEFCETVLSVCGQHARDENSVIVWNVMYTARCRSGYGQVLFGGRQPFTVKETICWDKGQGFPTASKGILSRNWELIFILSKGEKYNTTQGDNEPRWAKWDIGRPKAQEETHKATYPIELPSKAMNDFSFADSIVYEPFSGSGTTIIACENLKRKCRAIEISPGYVAVALERWATHTGQQPQRDETHDC